MKLGMNLLLWTASVTEAHYPLLERMKQLGFDGVELPLFEVDEPGLRRLRGELDRLGLERTTVTVCTPEANPISPEASVRQAALESLRQRIDASALVGGEVLCGPIHSALGLRTGRGPTADEWRWCVEVLAQAADYARSNGVLLSVEPLNRFEVYFLNTAADANRLVAEIDNPALGYLYDTFHANIEEKQIYASLVDNFAGVNHIHISENDRGVPGSGHVHWEETFRAIRDTGYDGWLTIEAFGRALPELAAATCVWRDLFDEEDRVAREGAAFVRRSIAQAELA